MVNKVNGIKRVFNNSIKRSVKDKRGNRESSRTQSRTQRNMMSLQVASAFVRQRDTHPSTRPLCSAAQPHTNKMLSVADTLQCNEFSTSLAA